MKFLFYFVPFLFFIGGYLTLGWLTHVSVVPVPSLVGMSVVDALKTVSDMQLNARVVAVQEEPDMPEGTVISHVPMAGSTIKTHQRIFMVVSKHPVLLKAPSWASMPIASVDAAAHQLGIRLKKFYIHSRTCLKDTVIAQFPTSGQPLPDKTVIVYVSSGDDMVVIMPDLRSCSVEEVTSFCARHEIGLEISSATVCDSAYPYEQCNVKYQRPLAGSLIDLRKGTKFQVSIEKS